MKRRLKPSRWSTVARKIASWIAFGLIIIWVALSPRVCPRLYAKKLFYPQLRVMSDSLLANFTDVPNKEVDFTVNGAMLRGWFFANPSAHYIYLLHPGNSGNIPAHLELIKLLLKSGCSVFTYEPRGFGESQGHPTIKNIIEDGLKAYDVVRDSLHFTADQIIVYGVSLGASIAVHVALKRTAAALVIQSGFASLPRIAREKVAFLKLYPDWMYPRPELNNEKLLAGVHPPLLILHGMVDSLIPMHHSVIVYNHASAPSKLALLPHSGHNQMDPADVDAFVQQLRSFVASL